VFYWPLFALLHLALALSVLRLRLLNTVESHYVKLGLLEISVKSKFFWGPVLNLVLNGLTRSTCIYVFTILNFSSWPVWLFCVIDRSGCFVLLTVLVVLCSWPVWLFCGLDRSGCHVLLTGLVALCYWQVWLFVGTFDLIKVQLQMSTKEKKIGTH
jgi:hypothetical protein